MKKTIFALILVALVATSCRSTRDPFPSAVPKGGPCPQNKGFIGYGRW